MFEQVSTQVLGFSKNFAQSMIRANSIAIEGFEKLVEIQLKAFEGGLNAAGEFAQEMSEMRDVESMRTALPKGLTMIKDQAEKAVATFQEVVGINTRTNEALVGLVKGNVDAVNDSVNKSAKAASKRAAA
jgi:hypothetical protein